MRMRPAVLARSRLATTLVGMADVIPLIAERFRAIAPDLRGHGWSDAPLGGYEKQQLAADLLDLLDVLGVEQVTWVGHDWGGWCGFLAALEQPQRIERMLALCIPHPWTPRHPRELALLGYQGPISLPIIGRRVARPMIGAIRFGRGPEELSMRDIDLFRDHIPPHVSVAMYRTFLTREVLPIARGRYAERVLDLPSTVLVGGEDPVTQTHALWDGRWAAAAAGGGAVRCRALAARTAAGRDRGMARAQLRGRLTAQRAVEIRNATTAQARGVSAPHVRRSSARARAHVRFHLLGWSVPARHRRGRRTDRHGGARCTVRLGTDKRLHRDYLWSHLLVRGRGEPGRHS